MVVFGLEGWADRSGTSEVMDSAHSDVLANDAASPSILLTLQVLGIASTCIRALAPKPPSRSVALSFTTTLRKVSCGCERRGLL